MTGIAPPTARRTARLLLVDSEAIVRFGLRQLVAPDPELAVVGEAASPRDALVVADRCPPDLVILDVDLGRGDSAGVDLARMLLERHRGARILVLTGNRDREVMMRTVRLGVHGYLRKGAETADILRAIHALLRGESVFDSRPRGAEASVDVVRDDDRPAVRQLGGAMLTDRENQVLRLLAVGMSNREIGARLLISEATVKFHVRNLRDKLEVRRRTEIVYTATRQGIV
ncbi:response regulator transcription factor [Pseudonocardia broussonetiae]|uniref:Response regulator transcription factor n=2 Tax=Pseudonocardia broussonetiae TaxID=2736640 RepID=A0A6M6JVK5_9PSEU|nr:response regulator transcription factor [Pseudonocardia broussonetiae]